MALLTPKPNAPIETDKLKKGDVVQLRSGGSAMTVYEEDEFSGYYQVYWHDERGVSLSEVYPRELLIRVR